MKKTILIATTAFLFTQPFSIILAKDSEPLSGIIEKAKQGDITYEFKLGMAYLTGKEISYNAKEGVSYLLKAANKGHTGAQINLAGFYYDGIIVPKNYEESARLYELAAQGGDKLSQAYLGEFYKNGVGVKQNYVQSYAWLTAAKENPSTEKLDVDIDKLLKTVSEKLTSEEIKKASQLRDAFKKKN